MNDAKKKFCSNCNSKLDLSEDRDNSIEDRDSTPEKENYKSNEGFARSDANYINAEVLNTQEASKKLSNIEKQPSKAQRKFINQFILSRKSWISISIILLIIMVSLIALIGNSHDGEYANVAKDAIEVYSDRTNMVTYVFNSKGDILQKLEQGVEPYYTTDHTAAILIGKNNSQTYFINSRELIKLNPGMRSYSMSENGEYIVYAVYSGINSFSLCLYDVNKHTEKIIDTIKDKQYDRINVLPDGKTVIYLTVTYHKDPIEFLYETFVLNIGDEPETLGKDIIVFEVSKDTKYLYYEKLSEGGEYEFYVKSEAGILLLSNNIIDTIYFNRDKNEIMFSESDKTYLCINGKERQEVTDSQVSNIIVPKKAVIRNNLSMRTYSYGFDTFKNKVILCKNNIKLIDNQYQSSSLGYVSNNQQIVMSEDGAVIIYRDADKNLMKVSNLTGEWGQELIGEEIDDVIISAGDLSKIYYLKDKQLYYRNKNEEPVMITDNVSSLCCNQAGDTVFFLKDYNTKIGSLYYSNNGDEAKPVPEGDNVVGVKEWNFGVIYQKEIDGMESVFYNTKGTNFKLLLEGVDFFEQKIKFVD